MRCLKCKKEIDNYAKICPYCGTCQIILRDSNGKAIEPESKPKENPEQDSESQDILQDNPAHIGRTNKPAGSRWKIFTIAMVSVLVFGAFMYRMGKNEHAMASKNPDDVVTTDSQSFLSDEKQSPKAEETAKIPQTEVKTEAEPSPITVENMKEVTEETEAKPEEQEHSYKIIMGDFTWEEAYDDALSHGGYLVNFESDEEFEKVKQILHLNDESKSKLKLWIGGKRTEHSYEYRWIDSENSYGSEILNESGYWMKNEPSFRDDSMNLDEYYMDIFFYKKENRWVWNDAPNDIIAAVPGYAGTVGYICEFEK